MEVMEHHGGIITNDDALIDLEKKRTPTRMQTVNLDELVVFAAKSKDKALAIAFLKICDKSRYGVLVANLENKYSVGTGQYPTDLPSALSAIDSYVRTDTSQTNRQQHV